MTHYIKILAPSIVLLLWATTLVLTEDDEGLSAIGLIALAIAFIASEHERYNHRHRRHPTP